MRALRIRPTVDRSTVAAPQGALRLAGVFGEPTAATHVSFVQVQASIGRTEVLEACGWLGRWALLGDGCRRGLLRLVWRWGCDFVVDVSVLF